MFTGIIEALGRIESSSPKADGRTLRVETALGAELTDGESVSVSGVCLTVASRDPQGFSADVSPQTLRVTTLGSLGTGRLVNLERSMRADARFGGHFVLGHVDGVGRVADVREAGDYAWVDITVPETLVRYLIPKGSIAIEGISLTVAALEGDRVGLQIVPFTRSHTSLSEMRAGDLVNVETDMIGKHVARLMPGAGGTDGPGAE